MQGILLEIKYFEKKIIKKHLKKLTFLFLLNPVPFNGQSYQKLRSLELVTSRSSGYKTSSKKFFC